MNTMADSPMVRQPITMPSCCNCSYGILFTSMPCTVFTVFHVVHILSIQLQCTLAKELFCDSVIAIHLFALLSKTGC